MCFADVEGVVEHHQGADDDDGEGPDRSGNTHVSCVSSHRIRRVRPSGTVAQTQRGAQCGSSRHERGPASFRHRLRIRFRNISDLTSHSSFAKAKLCEPGDDADRSWGAAHGGIHRLAERAGHRLGGLVNGQRGQVGKRVTRALVGLATTLMAAVLLAPAATASPIGDAEAAIMAAWDKAGGNTSTLGARKADVYPVADGFACDFDNGTFYYSTATGAKSMYGPILDKYDQLGGPAGSDLGFPTINEVPGLAGPDSRVATFSASDKPVIFWTPDHGAFVVRGALNAAWDKLGSSGGVLGAPAGDETYNGEVSSQKFGAGQISWNRKTKEFTTEPAGLAEQLKGLQVAIDPTAAINMAWRAAGGVNGPLGAKQGGQYPIGGDGIAQNFAGGKVFFSPPTGANAVESDILSKYESLGGPVSSELGFPIANESDGGIAPNSRIVTFSAADKPVIFWTSDHGAYVVRGAMKAAWDKLRGPTGKLGAPVGDQTVDGDVISQKFTGGKISWNRAKNTFSTDPANLAPLLSGLQVSGQNQPSATASSPHAKGWLSW